MEQHTDQKKINSGGQLLRETLPYLIAIIGTLISIILWILISTNKTSISMTAALPWVILLNGISIALLCGLAIRLAQLFKEKASSLKQMDQAFKHEIAEHLKAEETKKNLEIALLQGQKLQAIGTLAGGIAHDFNNILYAIKGYVEMSREDSEKNSLVYQNLGKVLEATQRGQDLVARILAFGRRHQQVELSPIDVHTMLENVLSLLQPTIPASVTIQLIQHQKTLAILGNQTQLHQVIVNIINNAVDAMDGEGTITIEVHPVSTEKPCNHCVIDITDTGNGMDQTTAERIFDPFFTTKEVGKGTGLGLSTVHAIMKQHQGDVTVKSQLGKGSTFSISFPKYHSTTTHTESNHGDYSFSRR